MTRLHVSDVQGSTFHRIHGLSGSVFGFIVGDIFQGVIIGLLLELIDMIGHRSLVEFRHVLQQRSIRLPASGFRLRGDLRSLRFRGRFLNRSLCLNRGRCCEQVFLVNATRSGIRRGHLGDV